MEELTMEDLEGCQIERSLRGGWLGPTNQVFFSSSNEWKKKTYEKSTVECFPVLPLNGIVRGPSFSGVCPSARFMFDLLGGVGGCGRGRLIGLLLLILCGLWWLLSGLFILRWRDGGVSIVVGGKLHSHQ